MGRKRTRLIHSSRAMSVVELLVSIAIMGIAVVGLTEILWINGSFSTRVFNKVDNTAEIDHFFEVIGKDLRSASSVTVDNTQQIRLTVPYVPTAESKPPDTLYDPATGRTTANPNGFPSKVADQIQYDLQNDPVIPNTYVIWRRVVPASYNPSVVRSNTDAVVLKNIIGPSALGSSGFRIFQGYDDQLQPTNTNVECIGVNVELLGTTASKTQKSSLAARKEIWLHNRVAQGF